METPKDVATQVKDGKTTTVAIVGGPSRQRRAALAAAALAAAGGKMETVAVQPEKPQKLAYPAMSEVVENKVASPAHSEDEKLPKYSREAKFYTGGQNRFQFVKLSLCKTPEQLERAIEINVMLELKRLFPQLNSKQAKRQMRENLDDPQFRAGLIQGRFPKPMPDREWADFDVIGRPVPGVRYDAICMSGMVSECVMGEKGWQVAPKGVMPVILRAKKAVTQS